ncbi:hypothetical protein Sjap_004748 [Stephania japonica]|uniref:Retrotransposon Copia-like N-terminal domain-containing protein n=1 Tax=Stephania japonica TaxID=461633 RepID=A0AAP0K3S7_9MAGN
MGDGMRSAMGSSSKPPAQPSSRSSSEQGYGSGSGTGRTLYGIGNSLSQIVTIQLDNTNFMLWKSIVVPVIRCCEFDGFLFGTTPCPDPVITETGEPNLTYREWINKDQMLLGWLLNAIVPSIDNQVVGPQIRTVHDAWLKIKQLCGAKTRTKVQRFKIALHTTRKGSMSMNEYLLKMKELSDSLTTVGSPITEEHQITSELVGLDMEYMPIMTTLLRDSDLTWQNVHASLLNFDERMTQIQSLQGINSLSTQGSNLFANADKVHSSLSGNNQQSKSNVFNNNQSLFATGSQNSSGYNNRGFNPRGRGNRGQNRGGFRSQNQNKPTCQICGKFGHSVAYCYYRADMKYMGTQSGSNQPPQFPLTNNTSEQQNSFLASQTPVSDSSWYSNSGATTYVTADPSMFTNYMPYTGKSALMVGNGKLLLFLV